MENLKLSLIDNDYAVQAHADLNFKENSIDAFLQFFDQVREELVTGKTAILEVCSPEKCSLMFIISQPE